MKDQTRNLNPTPQAAIAMVIWGAEYAESGGGSMDFYDSLSKNRKRICDLAWEGALKAGIKHKIVPGEWAY